MAVVHTSPVLATMFQAALYMEDNSPPPEHDVYVRFKDSAGSYHRFVINEFDYSPRDRATSQDLLSEWAEYQALMPVDLMEGANSVELQYDDVTDDDDDPNAFANMLPNELFFERLNEQAASIRRSLDSMNIEEDALDDEDEAPITL